MDEITKLFQSYLSGVHKNNINQQRKNSAVLKKITNLNSGKKKGGRGSGSSVIDFILLTEITVMILNIN